ncbi:nucleotidyltransferase substrate binding protein [Aeromonas veronii]
MMLNKDIRWHQRLSNFDKALSRLTEGVELANQRALSPLEEQGLIQAFEYNYELSWNLIKDFYQEQGETNIQGSRDAFRLAFKRNLITEGEIWMAMIKSRMLTSHTYNEETAKDIAGKIKSEYWQVFGQLSKTLNDIKSMEG